MDFANLISQYGYFAVLAGCLLEGETVLVLAGYAANRGYLDFTTVLFIAWFGAILGDQFYFWLGRRHGTAVMQRFPGLQPKFERAMSLIEEHPRKIIFAMRFVWGMRTVLPIALGLSDVSRRMFFWFNTLSAAVWVVLIGTLGYVFGVAVTSLLEKVKHYEHWIIFGILATLAVLHFAWSAYQKKREKTS
jgi:membrane protein DedA with SNARE-associated domain